MTPKPPKNYLQFKGFSLIELMIAVAIIGILAAIAVPQYSKYVKQSRTSEAVQNLSSIAMYQETYFSENDNYITCAANPSQVPTPQDTAGRLQFDADLGNWAQLGRVLADNTPVYFQYEIRAGQYTSGGSASTIAGVLVAPDTGVAPGGGHCQGISSLSADSLSVPTTAGSNWFYATAVGDQDGDGTCSLFIGVVDRPDIVKENDIE